MQVISMLTAKAQGLKRYFTGRACGLHVVDNLRLITSSANKAKSNRFAGV